MGRPSPFRSRVALMLTLEGQKVWCEQGAGMADNWSGYRRRLGEAVSEYIEFLKADGKAFSTIDGRKIALNRMLKVLGSDIYVHSLEPQHMTRVWTETKKNRSANTTTIDYQAYKLFIAWCEDYKYRARFESPLKHISRPVPFYPERRRVPQEKFPELLTAASTNPRDRMFVACGLYILGRKVEMSHIQWGDIDRTAGEIILTRFKTKDDDILPISTELEAELDYYEDWYRWVTDTGKNQQLNPSWYLCAAKTRPQWIGPDWSGGFLRPDRLIDKQSGTDLVKKALGAIGFELRNPLDGKSRFEGAHTLRRSGARALYDTLVTMGHDGALRVVMAMLGHSSILQTEKYIGLSLDKKARNDLLRGHVMYPKAAEAKNEFVRKLGTQYGHLRVVS